MNLFLQIENVHIYIMEVDSIIVYRVKINNIIDYAQEGDAYLLAQLNNSFAGKCFERKFIIRVDEIINKSHCTFTQTTIMQQAFVDVEAKCRAFILETGCVIPNVEIKKGIASPVGEVISAEGAKISVNFTSSEISSIPIGTRVSVCVNSVSFVPLSNSIVAVCSLFPKRPQVVYQIVPSEVDRAEYTIWKNALGEEPAESPEFTAEHGTIKEIEEIAEGDIVFRANVPLESTKVSVARENIWNLPVQKISRDLALTLLYRDVYNNRIAARTPQTKTLVAITKQLLK